MDVTLKLSSAATVSGNKFHGLNVGCVLILVKQFLMRKTT